MNFKEMVKLAKDPATTAENLSALVGECDQVNRLVAKHPNTNIEILEKLSQIGDKAVSRNILSNPKVPREIIIKLAPEYPKAFFKNPAIYEILSKDPSIPFSFAE